MGDVTIYIGPMFAGKTTALFARLRTTPGGWLVRSSLDTRGPRIQMPDAPVLVVEHLMEIVGLLPPGAAVFIDEGFLFSDLVTGVTALSKSGHSVFVATIQYDFLREWFANVRALTQQHESSTFVIAGRCITPGCAAPSVYTRRTASANGNVAIDNAYEPVCAACWRPPPE